MSVQRRNTRQRQLVLDAVCARCDHPTAEEIFQDVQRLDSHISRGTVYRNLNLLGETGAISIIKVPGGNRFDRCANGHPHVTCISCGTVADAPLSYAQELDDQLAEATGFSGVAHTTMFSGVCPACRDRAKLQL